MYTYINPYIIMYTHIYYTLFYPPFSGFHGFSVVFHGFSPVPQRRAAPRSSVPGGASMRCWARRGAAAAPRKP